MTECTAYTDRHETDFWAVWKTGMEWPELLASESLARDKAHRLAKQCLGGTVHLMKLNSVGTAIYPAKPELTGALKD